MIVNGLMQTNLQLIMAILLTLSGIVLLFCGFGETCTFAGVLFGVVVCSGDLFLLEAKKTIFDC
ncbi:sugar phosphate permease [Parabacteroides sp. PF5-9]|nr:sugar phosphate permease [Parabacteroides sp. PF5-9]